MSNNKSLLSVLPLFLVLFIDGMGLGLLFPILSNIIVSPHSEFLSPTMSVAIRDALYGFIVGIFMLCWFFGSAVLGDLSDTVGRKKALMICLVGAFIGYFISALAIIFKSVGLLIVGRIIAGFTGGSQPIAQAAIVDVSTVENKARNLGLILLSISLGFVFGPIFGGVLSDSGIVSWFSFSTPLYFASLVSLLNAFLLAWLFKETYSSNGKLQVNLMNAIRIFKSAFQHKKIRLLSLLLLIMIFGWSNYFTFISIYILDKFHVSPLQNSLFLAVLGLGFSIGCGYLINVLTRRFTLSQIITWGLSITAVLIFLMLVVGVQWFAWLSALLVGVSMSVGYSALLALFSNQVSEKEQGWVMGVTGSIMALCFGITSLFTGLVSNFGVDLPMVLAIVGLAASGLILPFASTNETAQLDSKNLVE